MLARDASRLGALAEELPGSIAIGCDVGDPAALAQALDRAATEGGDPKVLIHNEVGGAIGSFLDVEPSVLEANFHINEIGRASGGERVCLYGELPVFAVPLQKKKN